MQFDGEELLRQLDVATESVDLRNANGRLVKAIPPFKAIQLAESGGWVGVGNKKRVKYLRPLTRRYCLNLGSVTTKRLTNDWGLRISHPVIREHLSQEA